MSIIKLPEGIKSRSCPHCGYVIDQMLIEAARFNLHCPSCGQGTIADFVPYPATNPNPPGSKKSLKKTA